METWRTAMPEGMHLKSYGFASNLFASTPDGTLGEFCRSHDIAYDDERILVKLDTFIKYGLDFQARYAPDIDQRDVVALKRRGRQFELTLEDETVVTVDTVILAVGVTHFAHVPPMLSALPPSKLVHSSAVSHASHLAGKDVTVVGAGSSAVDLAALLTRSGARTRLLARGDAIRFDDAPSKPSFWRQIRHPRSGLGPGLRSWLYCRFPGAYRLAPSSMRLAILRRHLGPRSQYHLREVMERDVAVVLRHQIVHAEEIDGKVSLTCRDGDDRSVTIRTDQVIAATGYRVSCERLSFIDSDLKSAIRTVGGYPLLSSCFESSAPGLYFVGLAAAGSFGPLMRFVYGAEYAARKLSARFA